ncbi:glycosyltransferase [Niallia alba]|uniref:glycosyltransferase n=1 Tax=Niallia alba TaxID=2729105 RepID=UPI002E1AD475|nr:glycosyltransferase [Niallia alba]
MQIFASVGTHEQQMNRLIDALEKISSNKDYNIFIQYGYSTKPLVNCNGAPFLGYVEMRNRMKNSDIVITHGGPGTIIDAMEVGKFPIVVPRQKEYKEHVDNHQVLFAKKLEEMNKVILCLDPILSLKSCIEKVNSRKNTKDISDLEENKASYLLEESINLYLENKNKKN